jgi:TonB family protein
MNKRNRFAAFAVLFVCLCFMASLVHADDSSPEAKQLLQASHDASAPDPLQPYQLHGTVITNPGAPNEKKGHVLIFRDHDRWRTEFQIEDIAEVKLNLGTKLYVWRSTPMPIPSLGRLAETDHAWDMLTDDGAAKLSDVSKKKLHDQPVDCFEVKSGQKHRLCFDPERKVLLENLDQGKAIEFTDYTEVDHHFFPGKITVLLELPQSEKRVLVIQDIKVSKAQFTENSFAIMPRAAEFDTCTNMQPAKPLQTPRPEFSPMAAQKSMRSSPVVAVYGIVDKDGNLTNVKILNSDPEIQKPILEIVKKWRYTPAMCGSSPVASEKEISVPLFGGGGGDVDSAGRGR